MLWGVVCQAHGPGSAQHPPLRRGAPAGGLARTHAAPSSPTVPTRPAGAHTTVAVKTGLAAAAVAVQLRSQHRPSAACSARPSPVCPCSLHGPAPATRLQWAVLEGGGGSGRGGGGTEKDSQPAPQTPTPARCALDRRDRLLPLKAHRNPYFDGNSMGLRRPAKAGFRWKSDGTRWDPGSMGLDGILHRAKALQSRYNTRRTANASASVSSENQNTQSAARPMWYFFLVPGRGFIPVDAAWYSYRYYVSSTSDPLPHAAAGTYSTTWHVAPFYVRAPHELEHSSRTEVVAVNGGALSGTVP